MERGEGGKKTDGDEDALDVLWEKRRYCGGWKRQRYMWKVEDIHGCVDGVKSRL